MRDEILKLAMYRLTRAQNALEEGAALYEKGFFAGAINRFYYAAFYAARALLATKELDSSKHSGVIALFHENFVRTNVVDKEKAKALSRSFEERQDSDYEDFVSVTGEEAGEIRKQVEEFIDECESFFKKI